MFRSGLTTSMFRRSLLAGLACCCTLAPARAQGNVVEDWTRTLLLNNAQLHGAMIGADRQGSIFVTGHAPNYHVVTAKFAANGTRLWQVEYSNPGTREQAAWLAVDPFGDVVVAAYQVTGASVTPNGFVTLKYDTNGNLLWSDAIQSTFGSLVRVVTDGNGDVIVLGRDWLQGIVTIKYSRAGVRLWTRATSLVSTNQNQAGGLAVDDPGNIYVCGGTLGTLLVLSYDPNGNLRWSHVSTAAHTGVDLALGAQGEVYVAATATGSAANRTVVAKVDAAGNLAWLKTYPGNGARRIAGDSHGNMIVAGTTTVGGGYMDWLTHKQDPNGNLLWSATYDKHRYNDEVPYGLMVGRDDEVYVCGQGGPGPSSGSLSDLQTVTARYSRVGALEWAATSFVSLRSLGSVLLPDGSLASVGQSTFTLFHYVQSAVWRSLDFALWGSAGMPRLEGTASPRASAPVTLELSQAVPRAPFAIAIGGSRIFQPLLGGVLVPLPELVLSGLVTSTSGQLSVPLTWPAFFPRGFEVTFQAWIVDPGTVQGVAASNALVGVSG